MTPNWSGRRSPASPSVQACWKADLEAHAAAEYPGWVARFEVVRPYPDQELRVVFRQAENPVG